MNIDVAELLADVVHHAIVGRRGGGEQRRPARNALHDVAQALVVGAEVVPPIGYAVRFVDHQQADPVGNRREHILNKRFVG